jgi:hypothetical protein
MKEGAKMYEPKVIDGKVNFLLRTGKDLVIVATIIEL